jgi:hypothetical protein
MLKHCLHSCLFDLIDLQYSDEERLVFIRFKKKEFRISLVKMPSGPEYTPWVISSSDVRDIFGECYVTGLSAFIARLAETCYSTNARLPLHGISVGEVEAALEIGSDSLNDLVRRTAENISPS